MDKGEKLYTEYYYDILVHSGLERTIYGENKSAHL